MKINICAVKKELDAKQGFSFEVEADRFMPEDVRDLFAGQINVVGAVSNVGDVLLLEGKIMATYKNACGRCLEPLVKELSIDFCEKVFPALAEAKEDDALVYESDFFDLSGFVKDLLFLEQPINLLCCDDCKGLCPECGINLNLSSCSCPGGSIDPRLLALQQFMENKQIPKA